MEARVFLVLLASGTAAGVTAAGIFLISHYEDWTVRHQKYFKSFAAGILITVSILHLIPEAHQKQDHAPAFLLCGFFLGFLLSFFLKWGARANGKTPSQAGSLVPVLGIGLHSFLDGIIYTVTFNISIFTGLLAAIGMVFHEFPEGIVSFALLKDAGFSRRRALIFALLAASISTPLGAAFALPVVPLLSSSVLGALLSLSAGVLLYVGASHLLPEAEEGSSFRQMLTVFTGVVTALIVILLRG